MADMFYEASPGFAGPTTNAFAITPSDDAFFSQPTREIYVGGAGDLKVVMLKTDTAVTFKAVPVGTTLRIRVRKVLATGTTATQLLGLY